jgi:DNA-binding MarR family transcriptional regulator
LQPILLIKRDYNITAKEIAKQLGFTQRTAENYLAKLKAHNLIERVGSD